MAAGGAGSPCGLSVLPLKVTPDCPRKPYTTAEVISSFLARFRLKREDLAAYLEYVGLPEVSDPSEDLLQFVNEAENLILDNFEARKNIIKISKEFQKCATGINSTRGQVHFYKLLEEILPKEFNWEISLLLLTIALYILNDGIVSRDKILVAWMLHYFDDTNIEECIAYRGGWGCLVNKKVLDVLGNKYKLKSKAEIPPPKSPECKLTLLDPAADGNDSEFELPTHRLQEPYRKRNRQGIAEGSSPLLKPGTSAPIATLNQLGDCAEWDGSPIIPHSMTLPAAAAGSSPVRCMETNLPETSHEVVTDDSDEFMDLLYA